MANHVKPIPEGYHSVTPFLVLKDVAQALDFYKKAFGAEERMRFEVPGTGKIMHAEFKVGDSIIMASDESPEMECLSPASMGKPPPIGLYVYVEDADRLFKRAVEAGAKVKMPVADMFWGDRLGQVIDPSGHVWNLATHKEDLTPDQLRQRAQEFFQGQKKG